MKTILHQSITLAALTFAGSVHAGPSAYRVYFGTSARNGECGIYMSELDMKTGTLSDAARVSAAKRPGFITIQSNGKFLYATGEGSAAETRPEGAVSAYRIQDDGSLTDINTQPSGGAGTCHVSIDPSGRFLFVANYSGGSCSVLPIASDGSLAPPSSTRKHTGSSINPNRQTKAHAHSCNPSPDGRYAFTADLGMDKIMIYKLDQESGLLEDNDPAFARTEEGGGPRHFTFHPNGQFAYTNLELSNKVTVFSYDAATGSLNEIQTVPTLPEGFYQEPNTTAEVLTSPDGRYLYVSNRGHNSIAVFRIDSDTGMLTFVQRESVRGEIPRNFNIDPTGSYLIAANQKSNNVVVFKIDKETGLLEFTGSEISVPAPICVRFLEMR